MTRRTRSAIADETLSILESGGYTIDRAFVSIRPALERAVRGTVSYPPGTDPVVPPPGVFDTQFEVANETTFAGARRLVENGGHPCVLNFASATHPGGGFLSGAQAQEEFLARCSGLYPCLKDDAMYGYHRKRGGSLYTPYVLYSPDVPVFRDDREELVPVPFTVGIVTAAAVNRSTCTDTEATDAQIEALMAERIDKVLAVMRFHEHREIVLGAWGCGVFGNDARTIAKLFRAALEGRHAGAFTRVVFSVLDGRPGRPVYAPFAEVFRVPEKNS